MEHVISNVEINRKHKFNLFEFVVRIGESFGRQLSNITKCFYEFIFVTQVDNEKRRFYIITLSFSESGSSLFIKCLIGSVLETFCYFSWYMHTTTVKKCDYTLCGRLSALPFEIVMSKPKIVNVQSIGKNKKANHTIATSKYRVSEKSSAHILKWTVW